MIVYIVYFQVRAATKTKHRTLGPLMVYTTTTHSIVLDMLCFGASILFGTITTVLFHWLVLHLKSVYFVIFGEQTPSNTLCLFRVLSFNGGFFLNFDYVYTTIDYF